MNQSNIGLLDLWRATGNQGDLPTGWNGPTGTGTYIDTAKQAREFAEKQAAETEAKNAAQRARQDEFLGRFRTAVGAQEKLPDIAGRIGNELGLPQLQQVAGSAIQNLAQMPKVQTDAARGFNVNSNQLARIIGQKQSELAPQAQQAVTQQQNAEQQLGTRLGYELTQQQKDLSPFTMEQDLMSDQLAREYSGFTADKQNSLNLMMQQISNGQQLSMQQLQNANALALAKMQYDSTKNDASKLLTLSAGQTVYNPATNQAMYTSPYKPLSGSGSTSVSIADLIRQAGG